MTIGERLNLRESWGLLEALDPGVGDKARSFPEYQTPHGSVLLWQDSEGTRHVLVPIGATDVVTPDTESRGVQLVKTIFTDEGRRRHFVDIRCPDLRLYRVFDQIVASMLDELSTTDDTVPATCARVLASWRELVRRAGKPLSGSALRGVFGELWFLAQLVEHGPAALDYWTGPDNAPQDFVSAHGAFELKTSLRSPVRRVSINGLDQLDDQSHPFLILVVVSVAEDPRGASIEDLLDSLVAVGCPRDGVLDRLAKAGVQEVDLPEVAAHRWRVAASAAYRVDSGFLRVIPTSFSPALPIGIHNVRYEIELGAAAPKLLSDVELLKYRGQFMHGAQS